MLEQTVKFLTPLNCKLFILQMIKKQKVIFLRFYIPHYIGANIVLYIIFQIVTEQGFSMIAMQRVA